MSYKKLYKEIFEDRCIEDETGRYVVCEVTGKLIYESQITVHNFSHVKSKGSRPDLKYNKENIIIVSMDVHGSEHSSGKFNNYLPLK
jgi:hypothetical protein